MASPNVSSQQVAKLEAAGDVPILDSEFIPLDQYPNQDAEKTQGENGWYISSPVDGWVLHGPFA